MGVFGPSWDKPENSLFKFSSKLVFLFIGMESNNGNNGNKAVGQKQVRTGR